MRAPCYALFPRTPMTAKRLYAAVAIAAVTVSRGGEEIWKIHSDGGAFIESPLTYGQVPSSAVQTVPAAGPPVPLQPGDQVFVMGDYHDGLFSVAVDGVIIVP